MRPLPSSEESQRLERPPEGGAHSATKAERRVARARLGAYHEAELAKLIDRIRDGLTCYDAGEIDAFELDELVHRYKRATQKLWSFCVGSGSHAVTMVRALERAEQEDDLPNWWAAAEPRRHR